MLSKTAFFAICCLSAVQVFGAVPKSPKSDANDAQEAFNDFYSYSLQLAENLKQVIASSVQSETAQLAKIQASTIDSINTKLDQVLSKIQQIEENLAEVSIVDCTAGYANRIEALRKRLTARAIQCTELTSATINSLVDETLSESSWLINSLMSCYSRSVRECRYYATSGDCYDFAIDNIEKAKANLPVDYELTKVNFLNKIVGLKLPCQDLIEFELSVFPDLSLQTITQCAENDIRLARPSNCPNQYVL